MKRGHEANVRSPIVAADLLVGVVSLEEEDRLPAFGVEPPVDPLCFRLHLRQKVVIALDVRAARSADLRKAELSLVTGVTIEKSLDRQKPLQNTFGVVHAVHAHAQVERFHAKLFEERLALCVRGT